MGWLFAIVWPMTALVSHFSFFDETILEDEENACEEFLKRRPHSNHRERERERESQNSFLTLFTSVIVLFE